MAFDITHHRRHRRRWNRQETLRGRHRNPRRQDLGNRRPQPRGDSAHDRRHRPRGRSRLHRHALTLRPHPDRRPERREQGVSGGYDRGRRQLQLLSFPGRPARTFRDIPHPSLQSRVDVDRPRRIRRVLGVGRNQRQRREPSWTHRPSSRRLPARQPSSHPGRARHHVPARLRVG